jgi:alpha-L-rhamnosidase
MKIQPPTDLRVENLAHPLGLDLLPPKFSWIVHHLDRGEKQIAYQIIVCSELELAKKEFGDFWDSEKVDSERTCQIFYSGELLESSKRYYWRVRWWDRQGQMSPWSEISFFETGFLHEKEWNAKWISKKDHKEFLSKGNVVLGENRGEYIQALAVYLRKEFVLKQKILKATAYICGLGYYELRLNGVKIGDRVLDPAQTDYHKIALYSTYDLTEHLRPKNALGVILGNGRHIKYFGYDYPKLILQIEIEDESGSREKICSNETWKVAYGPLAENGIYTGEKYDARCEEEGWDSPDFDDARWENAVAVQGPRLASQILQPIRVAQVLKPKKSTNLGPGVFVYDFGQNFSGWVRLQVQGPEGTEIKLRHAELINEDGTLNTSPNQNAEATDIYILKGRGVEVYEPRFTYHGFRYVEVTGFPGEPALDNIEGRFVHTDVAKTGNFSCSNDLINRIHHNVLWGQLSNLMSIPTDCPQRDERHGWLGDSHLSAEEAIFNFDMAAFYTKYLEDITLAQKEDGSLPDTVPPYLRHLYPADPAWATAFITLAWYLYFYYEDTRILEKYFKPMKKYVEYITKNAEEHIQKKLGKYGDWCPPGSIAPKKTPMELTSTWYYYHDVLLLSKIAKIINREDDARTYAKRAQEIKDAFNKHFLRENQYAAIRVSPVDRSPNQTSNILPLWLHMVPEEKKEKIMESLLHSIVRDQDYHLNTGIIGTRYLLDVLTENGYEDIAYKLVTQKSYPSWGYMVEEGATTLWERWEKITGGGMNSHNHIMLGSVDAWFYKAIAGISCIEPGWRKVQIKPIVVDDLRFAAATVSTIRGDIRVDWKREDNSFKLAANIPLGTEAEIFLPYLGERARVIETDRVLWEKGQSLETFPDILFSGLKGKYLAFKTWSGSYQFRSEKIL